MITKVIEYCRYTRLDIAELNAFSTKRLLSLLKKVRRTKASYGWQVGIEGDECYSSLYEFYNEYFCDMKNILSKRPHIERKK